MQKSVPKTNHLPRATPLTVSRLAGLILGFGLIVRLAQYLPNRSLWADEAVLAVNIVERSFTQLLQPLAHDQAAPIGFLWVEKLLIQCLGNHEYSLRLFPLLCGIISLFLFYRLAQQLLTPTAGLIALTLFASLNYLVYYSSEVKQYSSDVAIAIGCFLLAQQVGTLSDRQSRLNHPTLNPMLLSISGAILIWFSHPAIFTLLGVGIGSIILGWSRKNKLDWRQILPVFLSWLISFIAFYWMSLGSIRQNESLSNFWTAKSAFPTEVFDLNWLFKTLVTFFEKPLGFSQPLHVLAILFFGIGCVVIFRREKLRLPFILSPAIATLFAAYLQKYPFQSRLILFITPFVILVIAAGAAYTWQQFRSRTIPGLLTFILLFILIAYPVFSAANGLVQPRFKEEIKPIIQYVKAHQQPNDVLYIFQRGIGQFQYYAPLYGYRPQDYILGSDDLDEQDGETLSPAERQRYHSDLKQLRGHPRVWLIFSHAHVAAETEFIRSQLNRMGQKLDEFQAEGAFVYLYNLK